MDASSKSSRSTRKILAEHISKVSLDSGISERPNLVVDSGETVVLSYQSERFRRSYAEHRPKSVDEIRTLMGVHPAVAEQAGESGKCACHPSARLVGEADLEDEDPAVRGRALSLTRASMRGYVMGAAALSKSQKSVLDKYVAVAVPIIHVVFLEDITVNDGATLTIAADTHAVYARNIRIIGSGRIVCVGPTTFNCTAVEGDYHRRRFLHPAIDVRIR